MDLPVSVAIIAAFSASTYATWVDRGDIYFDSVAMFVFFLSATRFLEMRARHRSEDHTLAMARLLPDTATRIVDGTAETVALDIVRVGDELGIRPGDVVPVDGEVISGSLTIDESMLTGESVPVERNLKGTVYAGTIVHSGNATIQVVRTGASRIASRFVIGVLTVTAIAATYWYVTDPLRAFEIALATLVVTCPCALALATPAAIAAATGRLARAGFLLVRARVLEILNTATVFVFDKTGTLTAGRPTVNDTRLFDADGLAAADSLALAAAIETASEHVIARAFEPYVEAVQVLLGLVDELERRGHPIEMLDLGGGWPINYTEGEVPPLEDYAAALTPLLSARVENGLQLLMEPGRCIMANSGTEGIARGAA